MISAPSCLRMAAAVLFPEPIPPVNPMVFMGVYCLRDDVGGANPVLIRVPALDIVRHAVHQSCRTKLSTRDGARGRIASQPTARSGDASGALGGLFALVTVAR